MGQAQINVRTRACSRTSIARTKQAALTHNVRGKELIPLLCLPDLLDKHRRDEHHDQRRRLCHRLGQGQRGQCDDMWNSSIFVNKIRLHQ